MSSVLRLFQNPEEPDGGMSPSMRLSDFYRQHFRPRLEQKIKVDQASPRSLEEYNQSVGLWVMITGDPPLERLEWSADGMALGDAFAEGLARRRGKGQDSSRSKVRPRTVNKHLNAISAILAEAGPRSKYHKTAVGILREPPPWDRLQETAADPIPYRLEELAELLRQVTDDAVRPAKWWRQLGIVAYYTGMRREALITFGPCSRGRPQTACAMWLRHDDDGCWLAVPAEASKTGVPYLVSIPPFLVPCLETLPQRGPWFRWPHVQSWYSTLARRHGIKLKRIRQACATQLTRLNPAVASMQLGHRGKTITARHYVGREVQAAVVATMPRLQVDW